MTSYIHCITAQQPIVRVTANISRPLLTLRSHISFDLDIRVFCGIVITPVTACTVQTVHEFCQSEHVLKQYAMFLLTFAQGGSLFTFGHVKQNCCHGESTIGHHYL